MVPEKQKNIQVFVRVRPQNEREFDANLRKIVGVVDDRTLIFDPDDEEDEFFFQGVKQTHRDITKKVRKKLTMDFDGVFNDTSSNEDIFMTCTKPLVNSVMDGYNCSVFVYGATGAGKTYTMLGNDRFPGITFLTMQELFNQIEAREESWSFDVYISYLEVYNEQVMNLIKKTGPLRLCDDSKGGVIVSGLTLISINSAEQLFDLLMEGNRNRTQHPTDSNAESSRSHAIFQVHIRMTDKKDGRKRSVKLSMIDLAGSERAAATKGIGVRFKEGASINKSLLALGNCINKLADGSKHIPYRDSNLTRILKDSLGGICQTVMIANVSPSSLTYEDTYNTLKYASRAKTIRTIIRQNALKANMPKEYYMNKFCEQQEELERLKILVKQMEHKPAAAKSLDECDLKAWYSKIDAIYADVIKSQEQFLQFQSKEKILKYRSTLKEKAEERRKILTLDGSHYDQDIARIEASIDRFEKQVVKQKDDINLWRKRFHDALKELGRIRKEIETTEYATPLLTYFRGKDWEVENFKNVLKAEHVRKIHSLVHADADINEKIVTASCEIIQNNFLLLRATGNMDARQRDTLNDLLKMITNQRDIIFNQDLEQIRTYDRDQNLNLEIITGIEEQIPIKRKNPDDCENNKKILKLEKSEEFVSPSKFLSELNMNDDDETTFKRPQIHKDQNLNETQILHSSKDRTFLTSNLTAENTIRNSLNIKRNTNLLSTVLSDNHTVGTNKTLLTKALAKSTINRENFLNKISISNKENKKFSPNRIRKSPRQLARSVMTKALTSAKNAVDRSKFNGQGTPQKNVNNAIKVRINRAASIRIKK